MPNYKIIQLQRETKNRVYKMIHATYSTRLPPKFRNAFEKLSTREILGSSGGGLPIAKTFSHFKVT